MKNAKKFLCAFLAVAMVLTMSISVFAAPATTDSSIKIYLEPDKTTVAPGDTFTMNVYVTDENGGDIIITNLMYQLDFDGDAFTPAVADYDFGLAVDPVYMVTYQALLPNTVDINTKGAVKAGVAANTYNVSAAKPVTVLNFTAGTTEGTYDFTASMLTALNATMDGALKDCIKPAEPTKITIGQAATPTEPPATEPPATEPPATEAPATQAPATEAPATQAPATQAPATEAPATQAPATAAPTQPPVSETEFTFTISGDNVPESVKSLVVKSDIDSADSIVIERDANGNFTKTLPKGKTYSVVEIRDEKGDTLPLDVVQSELSFSETDSDVVIVEKEGEDAFAVAVKEAANVSGTADESADSILAKVENLTVTVTTPVQDGEPTVEDVVYSDATKGDFTLRLVDDHNIMVIYKGVAADKYIKVERTISEFGATIGNPAPNQVMPTAEISLPGHYTVDTDWYMITENGETLVSDTYEADYRTEYKAVITFKPEHELDSASENAKYYLNGAETTVSDGAVEYRYTTGGKASIGNSTFGTGGSSGTTATAAPSTEPVVTPPTAEGKQVFDDVPPTYWAYDYIMDLYNAGIVNGETANMYMPENNITRAEFTKIAVNVFGLEAASTTSQFSDVKASDWFAPYVIAATEAGLVNGISANEFAPNADITREQMATIIGRQMNMTSTAAMTYPDAASISDYAKEYVAGLSENGLLQGDETGNFRPQANAARSEASALLDRVYVLTKGEDVPEDVPETTEAPTAAPSNDNSGFSTGTSATAAPTATDAPEATSSPDASEAPEASATPEA